MSTLNAAELNQVIKDAGLSRTVYAWVMPETQAIIDQVLGNEDSLERQQFHDMYAEAWTQKQDSAHQHFFDTWKSWTKDVVQLGEGYAYQYPTAGASEPIREAIYQYAIQCRNNGLEPVIHVFDAEYEGYAAYAEAAKVKVIRHDRANWQDSVESIKSHHQFYISQPSAIDGNIWPEYDTFMHTLAATQPNAKVMLDLTYVGCVAKDYRIKADYENIEQIFFSLSKPFGLYYHRCGGVLSRTESKGLFGNQWFKNLLSLKIGTEMMKAFGVRELPNKYQPLQREAAARVEIVIGASIVPCDIFLLCLGTLPAKPQPIHRYLQRTPNQEKLRICLTPTMANAANNEISAQVQVRPHEKLEM